MSTKNLSGNTLHDLSLSGINRAMAVRHGIEDLNTYEIQAALNLKRAPASDGYRIPYFDIDGKRDEQHDRVRLHMPEVITKDGKEKPLRYLQRKGSGCGLYLSRAEKWPKVAKSARQPLCITEGEKKSIAACARDLPTIGLGGIWNGTPGNVLLPQFNDFDFDSRDTRIVFDGDRATNPDVPAAEKRIGGHLFERGARVSIVVLPPSMKLDDFLLKHTVDDFNRLDRVPFDERACLNQLRQRKGNADAKRAASAKVVLDALQRGGSFLQCRGELLYFDRAEKRLLSLDDPRGRELRAYIAAHFGIDGAASEWAAVHEALCNHAARSGTPTEAHTFAHHDRKTSRLYVVASDSDMFRITPAGHERVDNGTDGVLMRSRGKVEKIDPAPGRPGRKAFDMVATIPNFADGHEINAQELRLLFKVAVIATLFPDYLRTRPVLLFHGEKGSGKTIGGRAVGISLFGSAFQVSDLDRDKLDGLDAALVSNALTVVDNVDGRVSGLENKLALAATRGEITRRKLYSTMDEFRALIVSFLWLTSRDPASFTRDDVVDRLLYLPCERRESFDSESAIITGIEANRPAFWAYVLSILPAILKALRDYKPRAVAFRMADFCNFALAIAPVLGTDRKRMQLALERMERERMQFASEMSVLPAAFAALLDKARDTQLLRGKTPDYIGTDLTASALLAALADAWPQGKNQFPFKRANALGLELNGQLIALRSAGIDITRRHDSHSKSWWYVLNLAPKGSAGSAGSAGSFPNTPEGKNR